jgi:hypothetical protein
MGKMARVGVIVLSPFRLALWLLSLLRLFIIHGQGLTLVHFSAQLEPCLTHKNTLHTLNTP